MLNIIATPIGNLSDITFRTIDTLKSVDGIICEDTRRTRTLLNHYQISKPLLVLNDFNEKEKVPAIIQRLKGGESFALISDAGTPLISDPGYKLIKKCMDDGIEIDSLPGPSATITALTLSGLPPDKFLFLGFLPDKNGNRKAIYEKIMRILDIISITFIIFVSPFRLKKTLEEMHGYFGDIEITLAKELTKVYQSVESKSTSDWINYFQKISPKGEYTLLFNSKHKD